MNKLACQYALLRFRPFVETGEFANVGVVLLSPEGRFFGYKLLKKYGRITQFFHQLDSQVYLNGKALHFDECRVVLATDPKAKLEELFDHYVERNFVTKAYQERLLENSVRRMLYRADTVIGTQYQQAKVGSEDFIVNFPFVRRTGQEIDRIIKPLFLAQDDPTRILTHGGQWVDKVKRLRRRCALPRHGNYSGTPSCREEL